MLGVNLKVLRATAVCIKRRSKIANSRIVMHSTADKGPQPETLFRPNAAQVRNSSQQTETPTKHVLLAHLQKTFKFKKYCLLVNPIQLAGKDEAEPKIPFPEIETLREAYEKEHDFPKLAQSPPEPDNPGPDDLPPNHPKEQPDIKEPPPEIDPRNPPSQPDIVPDPVPREFPDPTPQEIPTPSPPEISPPDVYPEFTPPSQVEMPDRQGGPEIQFPR